MLVFNPETEEIMCHLNKSGINFVFTKDGYKERELRTAEELLPDFLSIVIFR